VQSQSMTVDRQMKRYKVPRIAFVNKMDNPGANYERVAEMLKEKLGHHSVCIQVPMGAEHTFKGIIDPIVGKAYYFDGENGENIRVEAPPADMADQVKAARAEIIERVADVDEALAGRVSSDPMLRALADTVRRFSIPHRHLAEILAGVRMDLDHAGYETFDELRTYCGRVAGAVGLAAIHVWGFHSPRALEVAHDCGLAFQLTNILRDLPEDRDRGRLYLAREDLQACGCTAADVAAGGDQPGLARLARLYVDRTADCFREAARLDPLLTTDGRIVFRAMYGAYHALFKAVRRAGTAIFTRRVKPPRALVLAHTLAGVVVGPRP